MAKEAMKKLGAATKKLFKILGWLLPIAGLIVAVVFLLRGTPNPQFTKKPELLVPEYMKIVFEFLPPSTQLPTQADLDRLLDFFAKEDREWARKNLKGLAWLGMSQNDMQFKQADEQKRMQAAFKFLVTQGPTQPLTVLKPEYSEDKESVTVPASSIRQKYEILLVEEGLSWKIKGLWGVREKFATELARFDSRLAGQ